MSLVRRPRRASRLARRYGCFRLPRKAGVETACPKPLADAGAACKTARKGVNWLARTDPDAKQVEFSEYFDRLSPEGKRYIVLHERAHIETGPDHNDAFFTSLKKLVAKHRVSWKVAYELEVYNCFSGTTRFWAEGVLTSLQEKVGQTVKVLAGDGEWRPAKVKMFGRAELVKYTFGPPHKSKFRLTYFATSDHRWVTSNRGEVTDLRVSDRILVEPRRAGHTASYKLGRVHGLIFGDGAATTGEKDWYQIRLCGPKNMAFLRWLKTASWYATHSYPASYGGDAHVRLKTETNLKAVPPKGCDLDYQAGFLQGWLDADVTLKPSWRLDSIHYEALDWVIERAPLLGVCPTGLFVVQNEETNFGRRKLKRLTLRPAAVEYVVRSAVATGRCESVYCVEEPVTGLFTLDGGVVTGNCHHKN